MLKIYKINHLSYSTEIRSFTLFGALCWAYRFLFGEEKLKKFLEEFKQKPKFLISSPFPLINKETFLFPKPILPLFLDYKREKEIDICKKLERKKYKKAKYITSEVLKDLLNGKVKQESDFFENYKINEEFGIIFKNTKILDIKNKIFTSDLVIKNEINRITSTANRLFTEEGFLFNEQYFFIKFFDDFSVFDKLLKIIEQSGLGGNKNIGWGKIEIEEINHNLKWIDDKIKFSEKFITFAPIIPNSNIDIEASYYDFETFKQPVENTFSPFLIKKKVIYLKEGSIIGSNNKKIKGKLELVVKSPKIYQYGFEFPLKIGK